ncbi:MAG: hypothetical protein LBP35_00425 [Candidatus Ancillula trichonymphae]|jgi:hypothetical protein|nr:hypothetical protein [Candidatus Ancillula trichonymphae]
MSGTCYSQMTVIREPGSDIEVRRFSKQPECECVIYDKTVEQANTFKLT